MNKLNRWRFFVPGLALLSVTLLLAIALIVMGQQPKGESTESPTASETGHKLRLFDFDHYKRLFKKNYQGLLENLVHMKYFIARVVQVIIAAFKYQYGETLHYLAINRFSDATQEELDLMHNKVLEGELSVRGPNEEHKDSSERQASALETDDIYSSEEIEAELRQLVNDNLIAEPTVEELAKLLENSGWMPKQRNKRNVLDSVDEAEKKKASKTMKRQLPMSKLINTGEDVEMLESDKLDDEVLNNLPGKNPHYKPHAPRERVDMKLWLETEASKDPHNRKRAKSSRKSTAEAGQSGSLTDVVFSDLRSSGCFTSPGIQGPCGSCYAFAFTFVMEWLYCKKTGLLVDFSEQYMIDCGKKYGKKMRGCNGAWYSTLGQFVDNFGLELERDYPYAGRLQKCPYAKNETLQSTGYIRPKFGDVRIVEQSHFAEYLEHVPIGVFLITKQGFQQYGGGVDDIACDKKKATSYHIVVIVGHGRESGKEFWLIRNSYSDAWGEKGYYKVAKSAGCIYPEHGYIYGMSDGFDINMDFDTNPVRNNRTIKELVKISSAKRAFKLLKIVSQMLGPLS